MPAELWYFELAEWCGRSLGFLATNITLYLSWLQGGIGPAGLATEDLHVLDFTDMDRPRWHRLVQLWVQPYCAIQCT